MGRTTEIDRQKPDTQVQGDIEALFDYLVEAPIVLPNTKALARALDITVSRIQSALHLVRSREWIEEYGWTIPTVAKGTLPKVWFIYDTTAPDEEGEDRTFKAVNRNALPGIFTLLDRALAALQAVNEATDQRTRVGRRIKHRTDAVALSVNFLREVLEEQAEEIEAEIKGYQQQRLSV